MESEKENTKEGKKTDKRRKDFDTFSWVVGELTGILHTQPHLSIVI